MLKRKRWKMKKRNEVKSLWIRRKRKKATTARILGREEKHVFIFGIVGFGIKKKYPKIK